MKKKQELSDDDIKLFHNTVGNVKRMTHNRVTQRPSVPQPVKKRRPDLEEDLPFEDTLSDYETEPTITSDTLLEYYRPGIQHKVLRKLRTGQYNVEAILDLHGKTVNEARQSIARFLQECGEQGICHVLIIHGKGHSNRTPVLKNKLNNWLRQLTNVLAFCSATAREGHSGALYVLLKNQKGEK